MSSLRRPIQLPLIVAHRGESRDAPENTLTAFRLAWERGARAVELDVRITADGALVVMHDAHTRRIGGSRRAIAQQTLAELRKLDAGAWKHRRWRGERIPVLAEAIATLPPHGKLFIEIKDGPECVAPLGEVLQSATLTSREILVMSFNPATVAAAARSLARHEICLLLQARDYLSPASRTRAIRSAQELDCRSLDVEAHRGLTREVIDEMHAAGLAVYTWTVNRVATARRLAAAGIDGITTDRCAWLAAGLRA